jgi:hypothetical protein
MIEPSGPISLAETLMLKFPKKLCVYDFQFRDECIELLNSIQENANQKKLILLDMSRLEYMTASGAVALFSQITSSQIRSRKDELFNIILPKNTKMKRQIRESGLWASIRSGGKRKLEKQWQTGNKFQSGTDPDRELDLIIDLLEHQVNLPFRLKEAIQEALLNIRQHAYSQTEGIVPRWWQYSSISQDGERFIFVICDKGITIPGSLDTLGLSDADTIEEAMKIGVTSTNKAWRGKGSGNIKEPIEEDEKYKLVVLSRLGLYEYNKVDEPIKKSTLKKQYNGTLIAWEFNLKENEACK